MSKRLRMVTNHDGNLVLYIVQTDDQRRPIIVAPTRLAAEHLLRFARELVDSDEYLDCTYWKKQPEWLSSMWFAKPIE